MSNGFIAVAIAHDSTCKSGEEWVFHGLAKPYDVHVSLEYPIDARDKELLDKDMEELREAKEQSQNDFNSCGCINDMIKRLSKYLLNSIKIAILGFLWLILFQVPWELWPNAPLGGKFIVATMVLAIWSFAVMIVSCGDGKDKGD